MRFLFYVLLLVPMLAVARMNAEINNDECKIIRIEYAYIHNYVYTIGNCQKLYDMCEEDFCEVKRIPEKELNFGRKDIGLLYDGD